MNTTRWMVIASVVVAGGAGSLAEAQETAADPSISEVSLEAPQTKPVTKKVARWVAPELSVVGRGGEPAELKRAPRPDDAVRLALRHKRALFEHCFEMELRKQAVFSGFVVVSLGVSSEGQVTHARVLEGNRRESAVGSCIAGVLRTLKLPPLAYEAELILPIRLKAEVPVS